MKKAALFVIGVIFVCLCGFRLLGTSAPQGASPERASAWSQLGPMGGDIMSLARHPKLSGEHYALIRHDLVFRSTNNGGKWVRKSALDLNYSYFDIALDPKNPKTIFVL
ncbi:MAG: hypothetical protein MUQ00_01070 [Candidatus Aminicenantes bacterium]|nr:hypothetical protein [Candidatus Aminicenantes bacterium]